MTSSGPASTARRGRTLAGAVAGLAWSALLLQGWLTLDLVRAQGGSVARALWLYLGYFTVLTNALAALGASAAALAPASVPGGWWRGPGPITAVATAITVVMVAYHLLLRQLWNPQGAQWLADHLLHYVVPMLVLAWWWQAVPPRALRLRHLAACLAWPLAYLVYALLRGAHDGWYAYPFLDVTRLGYARVLAHAAGIALVVVAVAAVLVVVNRRGRAAVQPLS